MKILVAGSWPYANGHLHIGHIASSLPADVIARYHRALGDDVYFISGSDCHGTPVRIRAAQEGRNPEEISDFYHKDFAYCFEKLGFSYDIYGKTSAPWHIKFVKDFHKKLYEGDYIYEKSGPQAYCSSCSTFLTDRMLVGSCPSCKGEARGDQCEVCGFIPESGQLLNPQCSHCKQTPEFIDTKDLYLAVSGLTKQIESFANHGSDWRKNAIAFTNRYLNEGLRDRAITRNLDWGVGIPKEGYENKKIYIWAENVLGYLSASSLETKRRGESFHELWSDSAKHYYVHGKDNIPFHTIILPALLLAHGEGLHLPDQIVSSEYLTLEGRKISTSQNFAIWMKDIVERYQADSFRYFLLANGPEKRDTDFSWREYVKTHNGELLGAYGNFVNRTLAFIAKYYDYRIPEGTLTEEIEKKCKNLFHSVGKRIEKGHIKDGLLEIFDFVRFSNKYFDSERPWDTRTSNPETCKNTIFNCVQSIASMAVLLHPFLPFSSKKLFQWFQLKDNWEPQWIQSGFLISEPEILFERLDKNIVEKETEALHREF